MQIIRAAGHCAGARANAGRSAEGAFQPARVCVGLCGVRPRQPGPLRACVGWGRVPASGAWPRETGVARPAGAGGAGAGHGLAGAGWARVGALLPNPHRVGRGPCRVPQREEVKGGRSMVWITGWRCTWQLSLLRGWKTWDASH